MNIKQIVILLLISIFAFGFIDAADREQERESEIQIYYDGVYSGCILLSGKPDMTDFETFTIDTYCIEVAKFASVQGLMEKFYQSKEQEQFEGTTTQVLPEY